MSDASSPSADLSAALWPLKSWKLLSKDETPWRVGARLVTGPGTDAWLVAGSAYSGGYELHVRRYPHQQGGAERHPQLDGKRYPSWDAARKAAFLGGVLFVMVYEGEAGY